MKKNSTKSYIKEKEVPVRSSSTGMKPFSIEETAQQAGQGCTNQKHPQHGMNTDRDEYASTCGRARHLYDAKQEPQPAPAEDLVRPIFQVHCSLSLPMSASGSLSLALLRQPGANFETQLIAYPAKHLEPLFFCAGGLGRIRETPVQALGRERKNRAILVGVITDRNHIVPPLS